MGFNLYFYLPVTIIWEQMWTIMPRQFWMQLQIRLPGPTSDDHQCSSNILCPRLAYPRSRWHMCHPAILFPGLPHKCAWWHVGRRLVMWNRRLDGHPRWNRASATTTYPKAKHQPESKPPQSSQSRRKTAGLASGPSP
jgi:hypothetical protein